MAFLYMFDLVDFDEKGEVCATKTASLEQSRSNYLYLISKYNQIFLKELGVDYDEFFKTELPAVLVEVEKGGDFDKAKLIVLAHCGNFVQEMSAKSSTDRALVERLNENVVMQDSKFYKAYNNAVNDKERNYIITLANDKIFSDIIMGMTRTDDKKEKSSLFKNIIKYNNRILLAEKSYEQADVVLQDTRAYA